MKAPSKPEINKNNDKVWFIHWNHDVPVELWPRYKRRRERIKIYDDINSYAGPMSREDYAELRRSVYEYLLDSRLYNPFEEELNDFRSAQLKGVQLVEKIEVAKTVTEEETRLSTPINKAMQEFIKSRIKRKIEKSSISSYQGSVDWICEGLTSCGYGELKIGEIKHIHLSAALDYIAEDREWVATTINKEVGFLNTIFNWLATEDYVLKNPSKDKFIALPTRKSKHRWYDPETKAAVKKELIRAGKIRVYQAMQFTYWILIRSKAELRKLRIGDIDTVLKRIRFSADLAKGGKEQYRDYPPEFEQVIKDMKLAGLPQEWYVFGKTDGSPGPHQCSHNFFSKQFKVVKDRMQLSPDYTIYGMKHTRIVHELMKGTEGIVITKMARHSDYKTTQDYMRDYDLTLNHVYPPEELAF